MPQIPASRELQLVRAVFVGLLVLVILPSRLVAGLQPPSNPAWWTASFSGLLVEWWLLWRVCASRPYPAFLALAISGMFLATYRHPLVGALVYLLLLLIHFHLEGLEG